MTTLMACGDVAHGTDASGAPVCVTHAGTSLDVEARTLAPEPDLTGRKSKCGSCGRVEDSDGKPSYVGPLPFLRVNPNYDEAAGRLDTHYCGCRGWN